MCWLIHFLTPTKGLTAGEVVSSATELLLIEQKNTDGSLSLGMANPNLRPKMLDKKNWKEIPTPAFIELKGIWQMDGNVPGVFLKQWRMEIRKCLVCCETDFLCI